MRAPNCAICCWSLYGSAPLSRLGGTCKVRGSTSRNSGFGIPTMVTPRGGPDNAAWSGRLSRKRHQGWPRRECLGPSRPGIHLLSLSDPDTEAKRCPVPPGVT